MTDISGKVAFITGGASGLGLSMARAFASRGASIMLADRDEAGLAAAVKDLGENTNAEIDSVVCDVADVDAVRAAADATIARFGKVHLVVNNAGVAIGGQPGEIPIEDWRWIVDINLMGVVYGVEIFTPLIKSHGEGGHFINTASMAGHTAAPGMGPYNATKFAVAGYSDSLKQELAEHAIGVSCLCPAWVRTNINMTAMEKPSGAPTEEERASNPMSAVIDEAIRTGLSADDVGDWVADCVEANRLFIFTHPDFKFAIDERNAAISADYEAIIADGRFQAH